MEKKPVESRPDGLDPPVHTTSLDSKDPKASLRLRKQAKDASSSEGVENVDDKPDKSTDDGKDKEEVTWGKTSDGTVFRVPHTVSFFTTILTTLHRSSLTRWTFLSLIAQPILFFLWSNHPTLRSTFFLLYFAFWRGAYDLGFAWMLRKQSEKKWIVRTLTRWGWLDVKSESGGMEGREWAKWWKRELEMKMDKGYTWEGVPPEFNAWLMFRQLVDVVLLNDFVSYSCFAWSNLHFPPNHGLVLHVARWIFGWSLIFFNLWVKMDAHRVVKDYAWYWGDAFWLMVMQHDLVFDGVYEIAPHPMYSVGYAGYYGLSMVVGSYSVLFVSLAAHAAQFAFLLWFENPHIERTYGDGKKPLASRVPLQWSEAASEDADVTVSSGLSPPPVASASMAPESSHEGLRTPGATEGETDNEAELPELPSSLDMGDPVIRKPRSDSMCSATSESNSHFHGSPSGKTGRARLAKSRKARALSMHDLTHRFFRNPVVGVFHLDMFRSADFALVVLILYALVSLAPALPSSLALTAHFLHALSWRLFHSYGLGLLLRAQSKSKWLVRHYLKHYHYPGDSAGMQSESVVKRATEEAFGNWQVAYNISLVMTYISFTGLAWKTYHLPYDWTVGGTILRHVLGTALVFLHIWAAVSSYDVLGEFGWFYSDFFLIEQIPSQLAYTGIYRFLNNPERSMGGAAFFGLWLISNSKLVLVLAVISHLSHWWFLSFVERPHMQRLYGDRLRKDGGLVKTLKNVAEKTLATQAGKHATDIQRVVQELQGSFEKVEEKVTVAVEGLLDHARPILQEVVNDTKSLLQQSRERMIITRVASDITAYDPSRYSLTLPTGSSSHTPRFHVGQPIPVSWTAPSNHSRKDWIGIYRLGSCKSELVTRISSLGKWMPIYEDEWDGDTYVPPAAVAGDGAGEAGEVVFKGDQLPWIPGYYEIRYHHDGKHNVMSRVAPIEVYVSKPKDYTSYKAVRSNLLNIVSLSLDSDPKLLPKSAVTMAPKSSEEASPKSQLAPLHNKANTVTRGSPTLGLSLTEAEDELATPLASQVIQPAPNPLETDSSDVHSLPHSKDNPDREDEGSDADGEGDDSTRSNTPPGEEAEDDFSIMSEAQAKRIASLCEMAFGVEMTPEVVIAEANVGALARRVIGARSLREET